MGACRVDFTMWPEHDLLLPKSCTNSHYFPPEAFFLAKSLGVNFFLFGSDPRTYLPASGFGSLFRHPLGWVSQILIQEKSKAC